MADRVISTLAELDDVDGSVAPADGQVLSYVATAALWQPRPVGAGGDLTYTHTQSVPASVWTIAHNLGKHPSVTVVDSAGSVVIGDVQYTSANALTVTFAGGFSGTAYLN